ncbi:hypothetical protein QAD02_007611 [Eretmocerus hayati]|uniref:Uncharacterized protein n=1 Tax=Eretmocerus hayati TaxID=131215 RepID=A0ACC2N422_9HYME|nr:hypothetical protein QAD02_007611 [Eretmocerus hayati]
MENLLKEIQSLSKRFEEDRRDRNEGLKKVQDIADTMRKDLEAGYIEWGKKWNEIEKRDEERNAKQDRMEERFCKPGKKNQKKHNHHSWEKMARRKYKESNPGLDKGKTRARCVDNKMLEDKRTGKGEFKDAYEEHKKGRAIRGMILAIRKNFEILEVNPRLESNKVLIKNIKMKRKKWRIIYTYINREKEEDWKIIGEEGRNNEDGNIMILGDMNARTGMKGGEDEEESRNSKDKMINAEGEN